MSRSDHADDGHWNPPGQRQNRTESQAVEDAETETHTNRTPGADENPLQPGAQGDPQTTAAERHSIRNGPAYERNPQNTAGQHPPTREAAVSHDTPDTTVFRAIALAFAGFGTVLLYVGWLLIDNAGAFAPYAPWLGPSMTAFGLVVAGISVLNLATAYGTWTFTPWGRRLGIWLAGLGLLGSLFTLDGTGAAGLVGCLLYAAVAWYLYDNRKAYARLRESRSGGPRESELSTPAPGHEKANPGVAVGPPERERGRE